MARTRWNGKAWRAALVMLWMVALVTAAVDAAADCALPEETSELTLTAVTLDGADTDVDAYAGNEPARLVAADPGVALERDRSFERFEPEVAE